MVKFNAGTAALALAILMLTSCMRSPDCFRADLYCAGLVTDTLGLDDHGINQDAWAGLQASKMDGNIDQAAYIESVDPRDYEKNIDWFAQNGYDLIVTSGVALRDETIRAADLYTDSVFIGVDQPREQARRNLVTVTFAEDKMGFFAGALAAHLTETQMVAAVCETSGIDSMWRYCEGFRAGALSINKKIKVLVEYRDDGSQEKLFIDEAWGAERAEYVMKRGADVIFAVGGATGQGALSATSEAGIHAIGAERDQAAALGESGTGMVTSIYGRAGFEVQAVIAELKKDHVLEPVWGRFGYVPLGDRFPEGLAIEMDALSSNLLSGDVQTNIPFQKP